MHIQPSAEIHDTMRKMIMLGAVLSLWTAGNLRAADLPRPVPQSAYQGPPAALALRLAGFPPPAASLRLPALPASQEPDTQSLLLVAIVLLGLRMRARAPSEKFGN